MTVVGFLNGLIPDNLIFVKGIAPVIDTLPEASFAANGLSAVVTDGVWSNSPTSFVYQWLLNDSEIIGQTSNSLSLAGIIIGSVLKCSLRAVNRYGVSQIYFSNTITITIG